MLKTFNYIMLAGVALSLLAAPVPAQTQPESGFEAALVADTKATLSSRIDGTIVDIAVDEGENFDKGQTLVRFDCDKYRADKKRLQAERRGALAELESNRQLESLKSIRKLDVIKAEVQYEKLGAELERIRAILDNCVIGAPFSGIVAKKIVNEYETFPEGEPVLEVVNNDNLKVEFFASSDYFNDLKAAEKLSIYVHETGKTYAFNVDSVVPYIDPVSRTFKVIGSFENAPAELVPGMSGTVPFGN